MYNHVCVSFKPANQVLALTWGDIRVQFQSLFWPYGLELVCQT